MQVFRHFLSRCRDTALLHLYTATIFVGFLCNFFATVLPYWFAKYPTANTRFQRLGLWEICLKDFISPLQQQTVYTGCFYIFDPKIRPLWPLIFAPWFHAAQALQILSMILSFALLLAGFSMLVGVSDRFRPRTVITSVVLLALNCWVLLTQLGVVGVNVDLEKKQSEARGGVDTWMAETKNCGLSFCYALAAIALLQILIGLNLLVWCVYPRKERGGRLLKNAWSWPSTDDLPCCGGNPTLTDVDSYRRGRLEDPEHSHIDQSHTKSRNKFHQQYRTISPSGDVEHSSTVTYDPRSLDTVSEAGAGLAMSNPDVGTNQPSSQRYESTYAELQMHDPRTAIDANLSRVSSRMSSVRSSHGQNSSSFSRAQNRTYVIKKGSQSQTVPPTIKPKPLIQGRPH